MSETKIGSEEFYKLGSLVEGDPTRVWSGSCCSCCRFCGLPNDGSSSQYNHWTKCSGLVAYHSARAEGVDEPTALRIGARVYLRQREPTDPSRVGPLGPMIDSLLGVPSIYVRSTPSTPIAPTSTSGRRLLHPDVVCDVCEQTVAAWDFDWTLTGDHGAPSRITGAPQGTIAPCPGSRRPPRRDYKETEGRRDVVWNSSGRLVDDHEPPAPEEKVDPRRAVALAMVESPVTDLELVEALMAAMSVRTPGSRLRINWTATSRARAMAEIGVPEKKTLRVESSCARVPLDVVLRDAGLAASVSQARQLIEQGGVAVSDPERVAAVDEVLDAGRVYVLKVDSGHRCRLVRVRVVDVSSAAEAATKKAASMKRGAQKRGARR